MNRQIRILDDKNKSKKKLNDGVVYMPLKQRSFQREYNSNECEDGRLRLKKSQSLGRKTQYVTAPKNNAYLTFTTQNQAPVNRWNMG